ncbi:MAG: hypothetical protein WA775_05125 [Psychroserpens sp.]|uniref:hypothetical protein n=1 Tax=Psychroserpens sp. TaxID=2020870 RepID=UPI003C774E39
MAIDDSVDVSWFYTINEEEEEKESENTSSIEVCNQKSLLVFNGLRDYKEQHFIYFHVNYPKPHLNLIFQPPEFIS